LERGGEHRGPHPGRQHDDASGIDPVQNHANDQFDDANDRTPYVERAHSRNGQRAQTPLPAFRDGNR
jgi:hypothetical protein